MTLKESPRSIGGDGFRAWIDKLYQQRVETHARPEDQTSVNGDLTRKLNAPLFCAEAIVFEGM